MTVKTKWREEGVEKDKKLFLNLVQNSLLSCAVFLSICLINLDVKECCRTSVVSILGKIQLYRAK